MKIVKMINDYDDVIGDDNDNNKHDDDDDILSPLLKMLF